MSWYVTAGVVPSEPDPAAGRPGTEPIRTSRSPAACDPPSTATGSGPGVTVKVSSAAPPATVTKSTPMPAVTSSSPAKRTVPPATVTSAAADVATDTRSPSPADEVGAVTVSDRAVSVSWLAVISWAVALVGPVRRTSAVPLGATDLSVRCPAPASTATGPMRA
jgi:hypothetical protein